MDINKKAQELYKILINYTDYLEFGYMQEHEIYNFDIPHKSNEPEIKNSINNNIDIKQKKRAIIELAESIIKCNKCILGANSGKIPGQGNVDAKIFIVAMPVDEEEEKSGKPLVGNSGDYLNKWLKSININFEDVFISNILKCYAKKIKVTKDLIEICRPYLDKQLEITKPQMILALGQIALSSLKRAPFDIKKHHGELFYYNNIKAIATYNPSDVLSDQSLKKFVWEDLKKLSYYLKDNLSQ